MVALTAVAVVALLVAEAFRFRPGVWIAKPLASIGFVLEAWNLGAIDSLYGRTILVALVLSLAGDVLLIPKKTFLAGLVAFLLAHVAFAFAFRMIWVREWWSAVVLVILSIVGAIVFHWLRPHLPRKMRVPVIAYVAAIIVMTSLAWGVEVMLVPIGATMFFLSDLAVARDQFVVKTLTNKLWGLPLYYAAQIVLAMSVGLNRL